MWAIRNNRTRKWLYGTDWRYDPPHQRTAEERAMTFESEDLARAEMRWRKCGKDYEVIPVRIVAQSADITPNIRDGV